MKTKNLYRIALILMLIGITALFNGFGIKPLCNIIGLNSYGVTRNSKLFCMDHGISFLEKELENYTVESSGSYEPDFTDGDAQGYLLRICCG